MNRRPIAIVGSGFAGTLVARLLTARGHTVTLIERGEHPRVALGESSTPLAAICLERIAAEYDLPDLAALASYGRWGRELPALRRGLKRGFSFYGHRRGHVYENDDRNSHRLLVAASPDDEIADAHWMRSDVDAHLVDMALREGVEYLDRFEVDSLSGSPGSWVLEGRRAGRAATVKARFIIDASGAGQFLARQHALADVSAKTSSPLRTGLLFGHMTGVGSFAEAAAEGGASLPSAPYPEERAAVHHLLEEGWLYSLPFDDGVVSAGLVLDHGHPDTKELLSLPPADAWNRVIGSYPTLARQFGGATPVHGISGVVRLQRLQPRPTGPGWAMLPHTYAFESPMFSTGIAWSLVAVERLARAFDPDDGASRDFRLASYDRLLVTEAAALRRLIRPAYRLRGDFPAFAAWTHLYFAAASYWEVVQRIAPAEARPNWADIGFLGATDPVVHGAVAGAHETLRDVSETRALHEVVARLIEQRNVAGLCDPRRHGSYPVDLDVLIERSSLLGMAREEIVAALPRLRGI